MNFDVVDDFKKLVINTNMGDGIIMWTYNDQFEVSPKTYSDIKKRRDHELYLRSLKQEIDDLLTE